MANGDGSGAAAPNPECPAGMREGYGRTAEPQWSVQSQIEQPERRIRRGSQRSEDRSRRECNRGTSDAATVFLRTLSCA